jgi:biotin operon repressor
MNREQRIRELIPGATDDMIEALADRSLAEVNMIVAALRQARKDAIEHDRARRRQKRRDSRKFSWYDEAELAARNARIVAANGGRAAEGNLDALTSLADMISHTEDAIGLAVDGLRARGYSDTEIGTALGITRQAVGQHFGRKG